VINLIDPDAIVLGGGVSGIAMLYQQVPVLWSRHIFSDHVVTRLLPRSMGVRAGSEGQRGYGDRTKNGDDAIATRSARGAVRLGPVPHSSRSAIGFRQGFDIVGLARIEYSP